MRAPFAHDVEPQPWPRSRDEAVCPHGVGHPIDGEPHHGDGIHGCDGCCRVPHKVAKPRRIRRAAKK